ncbi:Wzz/FepE/Etk N-terminal domain-containing protein [Planococcus sp. APC 3906]|uniref:YveK family protein n=1 Tax=Planococcus sp. APC 3906 TaxID=3035194 RepID=UPI0025B45EC4|nr:Wzz/FepE/Etk N-terminal domain-containing protein [Planococcus sp. APC 3906]MDN3450098.1 Wzz/FepE/Etk N-terminal domain-containing protein [Planococcus sp. APC 3906]
MREGKSLAEILMLLKKYAGVILALTLLSIGISALASYYFVDPVYQASTQILVNQNQAGEIQVNNYDNETDLRLINTYSVIIKSPVILDQVIDQLELDTSLTELNENITVNTAEESQVASITIRDNDAENAVLIANLIAQIFKEEIKEIMNVDNVRILSPAVSSQNPVPIEPQPILNMLLAGFFGLCCGIGFAFLMSYLDTSIKNDEDIEEALAIPILGYISIFPEEGKGKKVAATILERKEI